MALPSHSLRNASKHSLLLPVDNRLSIIAEDGDITTTPQLTTRAPSSKVHHRPFSRLWGDPPLHNADRSPPQYSLQDATGARGEKLSQLRNNRHVAKRGGWKRICLIALLCMALVVGLAVGLAIGLKGNQGVSVNSTSGNLPMSEQPFPAGSYSLVTFLDSVSTKCTANPATWLCDPYETYAQSPAGSMATFNWIISGSEKNYTIASTNNPFAINFTSTPLSLANMGSSDERYTFSITLVKFVVPSVSITPNNMIAGCYFNNTRFEASLYTKKAKAYPTNGTSSVSASSLNNVGANSSTTYQPWPFAVEVVQSIGGGVDVPNCYYVDSGSIGSFITHGLDAQPAEAMCSCTYKNYSS